MTNFRFFLKVALMSLWVIPFLASCGDDDPPKSDLKEMTNVRIDAGGTDFIPVLQSDGKTWLFETTLDFAEEKANLLKKAQVFFSLSKKATANPSSGSEFDLSGDPKDIVAKAEDGSTFTYNIVKIDGTSSEAEVKSFLLLLANADNRIITKTGIVDNAASKVTFDISFTEGDYLGNAIPIYTLSLGANAGIQGSIPQDFSTSREMEITAHDNTKRTWKIEMNVADKLNDGKDIQTFALSFTEGGITFNLDINITSSADGKTGTITYNFPNLNQKAKAPLTALPATFTPAKMNMAPTATISTGASISPALTVAQNFSQDVKYIVTAEDGTTKEWTIKAQKYYMKQRWLVDYKDYHNEGVPLNPTSIAIIGDYIALARTDFLINKATGALHPTAKLTGGAAYPGGQAFPFFITNDDAGNMIGFPLYHSLWNESNFTIHKWTRYTDAPVLVAQYPVAQGRGFGRQVQVIGDINTRAVISAVNTPNLGGDFTGYSSMQINNAESYLWEINNGVLSEPVIVQTGYGTTGYGRQHVTPVNIGQTSGPYYVGTAPLAYLALLTLPSSRVEVAGPFKAFFDATAGPSILNPGPQGTIGGELGGNKGRIGFGDHGFLSQKLFTLNDNTKIFATLTSSGPAVNVQYPMSTGNLDGYYCFAVMEPSSNHRTLTPLATATIWWQNDYYSPGTVAGNVNGWQNTGSLGHFVMEREGNDIIFYVFPGERAIACYQFSKF